MKATGIVRRIDDLGRIVIPKEIRRNLRIREGAPLEIYVDQGGGLILKKYSPLKEMGVISRDYVESLSTKLNAPSFVVDHDSVIAVGGADEGEWLGKETPEGVLKCMEQRRSAVMSGDHAVWTFPNSAVAPIVAEGDSLGAVIVIPSVERENLQLELKLAETAAGFLARQIVP